MRAIGLVLLGVVISVVALAGAGLAYLRSTGLSARADAGNVEVSMARRARSFAIPPDARIKRNPVPSSPEVLAEGMAHYADHCANCHANDGSGKTEMGQGLFPKAPDIDRKSVV